MKRFEFTLETVLRVRAGEEQEWENRLATITGECARLRREIESFGELKRRCAAENTLRDIRTLQSVANYQALMDNKAAEAGRKLARKEKEREKILKGFIEASKKRKILDKLKERQKEEFHHLRNKYEEKMNDDLNNSRRRFQEV